MSNVRKVTQRPRRDGSAKVSWRGTWIGPAARRRSKTFARKGEADAHLKTVGAAAGGSPTVSVLQLAEDHHRWCDALVKAGARSPRMLDVYSTATDLHLKADPGFAATRLCDLTTPR